MLQLEKDAKVARTKDRLIELPDGILSAIISILTLKEAVRTSILSKSWRFIWRSHPDLLFDSANILGSRAYSYSISIYQSELDRQLQRCKFIEWVDHLMLQRCKGPKIDSLAIHFHLGKDSASHIHRWISCAVTKGVQKIDLDLSERCSFKVDYASSTAFEQYEFPCWLFVAPGKKCTVEHLHLTSCSISSLPSSDTLTSLITVELQSVSIIDQQLENLLSICLFLERLSLHLCKDLVNSKFVGASLRLKLLCIKDCFRLEKVDICGENLVMLEYTGQLVSFSFKNVPRLAEVFLTFTGMTRLDGVTYALTRLAYDLPQLETLNLISIRAMKTLKLPEKVSMFTNAKQLVLSVFPFHDEDELVWISYILKAFPLMHKLQLNLYSPSFIKQSEKIERVLPQHPHRHLSELEINGFYGNQHEVELLKYLLDNVIGLKVLAISPCQKKYKGFNNWDYEEASSWYKLKMECVGWLHEVLPPTVRLKIQ